MRKTVGWLVSLVLCLGLAVPDLAAQGKGGDRGKKGGASDGGGAFSVCVTFENADGDLIRSDFMRGYCDNQEGVLAIVGKKRGGFRLDTNNKGRKVSLDFSDCVPDEVCTSPFPTGDQDFQDVDLRIGEKFVLDGNGTCTGEPTGVKLDIVEMDGGDTACGALVIGFAPTGRPSKLRFKIVFGRTPAFVCPGDNGMGLAAPVTVVRGGSPGEPENSWTLSATGSDVGCLWKDENNFKVLTLEGRFHLPFSIDVEEQ